MNLIEITYYLIANFLILTPLFFLIRKKQVVYLPLTIYLFFSWLFLVVGIPFAQNVSVMGNYSFSFSFNYIVVLFLITSPVYIFYSITKAYQVRKSYINSLDTNGIKSFYYILWIISLSGVFIYVLLHGLPPLFSILSLSGSSAEIYQIRMDITYGGDYRRFDVFFILIPALATLLGAYLFKKNRVSYLHFLLTLAVYFLLSFSFLHKSHMVVFALSLALFFFLFSKKNMVGFFLLPFVGVLSLLMLTYVFYIGVENYGYGDLLLMIFERIALPYIVSLDFVLENFGNSIPLLMGSSFPNPKGIFDFQPVYFSNLLMNEIAGKADGTIPASAVGFMYANFGFLGVVLTIFFVLFYFLLLFFILKFVRTPLGLIIWVYLSVGVFNFSVRDPFGLIDIWIFIILFLFLIWKHFLNVYKKNRKYCS